MKTYVALLGSTFGYLVSKNNNLVGPLITHDVVDWIADLFF